MINILANLIDMLSFLYIIGLVGTFDILWPLKQIPNYIRWQKEKETKHKILMLEMELKEKELLRIEQNLEEELNK